MKGSFARRTDGFPRAAVQEHCRDRVQPVRRGVSLIEMLAAIATISVVGTISVTTMFLMLRAEGSGAKSLVASVAFSRLSEDFRRDVHAAVATDHWAVSPDRLEQLNLLQPNEQTVSYTIHADRIVRSRHTDGKRVAMENYELASGESHFEMDAEKRLIGLVHRRRGETFSGTVYDGAPVRDYRIEAVQGRDYRFDAPPIRQNGTSAIPRSLAPTSSASTAQDRQPMDSSAESPLADPGTSVVEPES